MVSIVTLFKWNLKNMHNGENIIKTAWKMNERNEDRKIWEVKFCKDNLNGKNEGQLRIWLRREQLKREAEPIILKSSETVQEI